MKAQFIKSVLACCIATLAMSSCYNEVIDEVQQPNLKEVQMKELIQYMDDITPSPTKIETRGFWRNFKDWFKRIGNADASGFGWARGNGANLGQGLKISIITSLVAVIDQDDFRLDWNINNDWKVYPFASREYMEAGNSHNRAIYELVKENPSLKKGQFSNDEVLAMVNTKMKAMGYNEDLTLLQRSSLMIMLNDIKNAKSASEVTNVFLKNVSTYKLEYQFMEEYLNSLLLLDTKKEMISFTEQIYAKIDSMSAVQRNVLKDMAAIGLSSINLWVPVQ